MAHQFEQAMPSRLGGRKAMRQVTLNLLSNAVKFTPSGGEVSVKVGWTAGGGQYLSIRRQRPRHSGRGDPDRPIRLRPGFDRHQERRTGTGLGLPIVQAILAKHGGQFILRSKLREGTERSLSCRRVAFCRACPRSRTSRPSPAGEGASRKRLPGVLHFRIPVPVTEMRVAPASRISPGSEREISRTAHRPHWRE